MTEITEQELTQAAIFDNHEMLSCLLEGECSEFIDKVDRRNRTPLYTAVSNNSKKCVRLLLENGANPNIPADETFTLMTPLHLAIEDGKLELIPLLLEYGADLNVPNADGLSPFQLAKMYEHVRPGTDVLDMLNKENDKRKRAFEISRQEFIQACIKEDVALMASILKASEHSFIQEKLFFEVEEGVATTYVEPEEVKMTALCLACKRRNKEMVELLLEKDADPYKLPSNGLSPVHIICTYNEPEILKILLKKNPELAALKSRDEDLPIHLAIKSGYMPMIKTLLEFEYPLKSKRKFRADDDEYCVSYSLPFDINLENARQHSPLYIASAFGYIEIVNYLLALEVEADFIPKNQGRSGKSQDSSPSLKPFKPVKISKDVNHPYIPLHVAVKNKHVGVVKMLLSCGANPNQFYMHSSTHQKISALFLACDNDDDVILCTLLSYGVEDIDKTVFYLAVKSHPNLIPYLLKYRTVKNPVTEHIINRSSMLLKHADNGTASRNSYFTPKKNGTKNGEDYKKLFPVTPVYCKWQELRLKDLAEEWLISAAFHHNQGMKSSDSALALHAITRIDLSGNQLAGEIPPYLFSLPSLHSLILSKNSVLAFPKEEDVVLDCPLLEEIKVDHNKLESIPSYVFSFPALRYLSASSNSLNHVPMEVWTCISLAVLNLADNNLSELQEPNFSPRTPTRGTPVGKNTPTGSQRHSPSPSISTPSSFVSLRSISDMDTVYDLDVFLPERHEDSPKYASYWRMNLELRESEGHSKTHKRCLLELDLSHNQLTNIPHWLCCCTPYLEHLNLSNNKIEEVGSLSKLPQYLKTLDLSGNKIVELQPWELDVTEETCYGPRSGAKCPHQQHMKLERLDTLNLSANPQLKSFIVSRMQISKRWSISSSSSLASLPVASEDLSQRLLFPNLTSLDLSQNLVLQSIPSDIGGLVHLKRLSLSKSRIRELPPELGGLKHLISLDLELCPLEGPIFDIVKNTNNTKTILGFLHSVLEEAVEYNCMNLMFVGVHDIGKTTLLNQIRKNREIPKGAPSPTHWNERRNRNRFASTDSTPLSTVGIDINELIIGRKREHGPVTFRTWDFGGQKEYYATHQYFLSPRSLYLVMWKLTDGEKGVNSMWQWLVNIQARAPGSPVIIVGTHKDVLEARATKRNYTETWEEEMNSLVKEHFINVEEPDKCGLPNIITFMNISCKNRRDTDRLVDLIYDTVFNLKHPRRKSEQILKHKIPKKYILLKEIVQELAVEREKEKKDPVLDKDAYLLKTMNKMFGKSGAMFRDVDDVEQATNFLHENGILFHYEDVGLKDLYFLNPQWLCDQLAQVVAIDQVNNYCRNGIMNASDLRILFKQSTFQPESIERYICGLLAKFEVALEFDRNRLILPSLLPTEMAMPKSIKHKTDVKISVAKPCQNQEVELFSNFPFHASIRTNRFRTKNRLTIDSRMLRTPDGLDSPNSPTLGSIVYIDKPEATKNIMFSLCRLYVMTYFPSGFWPRLITRILADSSLYGIIESLVPIPEEIRELCPMIKNSTPKWQPWQTGIKLVNYGAELFCLKEVLGHESDFCQYKQYYFKCFLEEQWIDIDLEHSVMLEISFPSDSLIFTLAERAESESYVQKRSEQVYLDENVKAKLMTLMTAHIDNLLHDWYPDLGEARFTQNCYGRYLITRIVPCPHCLYEVRMKEMTDGKTEHWQCIVPSKTNKLESADFQSVERPPLVDSEKTEIIYCFVVERSIVNFLRGYNELCKVHGSVSPSHMMSETGVCYTLHTAPDVVFEDIDNDLLIESSSYLSMDRKLGRGSYGDVFAGQLKKGDEPAKDVAIKVLLHSSGSFRTKDYMFMQKACDAYLMARQEVSILADVQHDHIVQIIGLSTHPLALVLDLAPCGALGNILEDLGKEGQLLSVPTIKQVILQVSDALAFLHFKSIIYRDLKADNVLVWKIPVLDNSGYCGPVHVKLADYGISRSVLPSGTKGYGGTAPFIAPEILQYGGKRTYTEKVDIFSFGMFMFELLTCSRPLEEVSNTTLFICQNGRPHITSKEKNYPCHFLDLMCMCWHPDPTKRPSAITIRQISDSAQFTHLSDAVSMDTNAVVFTGCSVPKVHRPTDTDSIGSDIVIVSNDYDVMGTQVWLSTHVPHGSSFIEIFTYNMNMMCTSNQTLPLNSGVEIHAMVAVDTNIWCVDNNSNVIIYSSETTQLISSCVVNTYDHTLVLSGHYIPDSAGGQVVFVFKSLNDNVVVLVKLPVSSHGAVFTSVKISMDSHSHCSCYVHFGRTTEMWIGQDNGKIAVLDLVSVDSKVDAKKPEYKILQHPNAKKKQCTLLVTNKSPSCSSQNSVWSYVYPGSVVQRWSTWNQQVECQLDCSIIAPVTETFELRSPSKSRLSSHNQRYQVTAISVLDKFLYIGTTWGCVIVANALTLQHYTVFKCHSDSDFFVRLILPLFENPGQSPGVKLVAGIVTVGKGYVPLIQLASKQELMDDDEVLSRTARPSSELERNTHVLSWMAKHWDF